MLKSPYYLHILIALSILLIQNKIDNMNLKIQVDPHKNYLVGSIE